VTCAHVFFSLFVYQFSRFFITFFLIERIRVSRSVLRKYILCNNPVSFCPFLLQFLLDRSFCASVSMLSVFLTVSSFSHSLSYHFTLLIFILFKLASLLFRAFSLSLSLTHSLSFRSLIIARLHRSTLLLDYQIPKLHSLSLFLSLSLSPCRIKARTGGKVGLTV